MRSARPPARWSWQRASRSHGVYDEICELLASDPILAKYFILFDNVSDFELSSLYVHSQYTVYPSRYEGWGLPVLESISFGKSCLCSNASSLPEAGGDFAVYLSPDEPNEWASTIAALSVDNQVIRAKEQSIRNHFSPRTWPSFCSNLLQILLSS
jgi:glycosyltransferase involved in cell wall biosynthesis